MMGDAAGPAWTPQTVARALDHAVLRPEYTAADLARHAAECAELGVGCLCLEWIIRRCVKLA